MRGKHLGNIKNHVGKDGEGATKCMVKPLLLDFMSGDIVWVKIHNSSWWPAQVVDEKIVHESNKTNKRMADEVLVRLYGSYDYLYVDPTQYYSEFENILKQNNSDYKEIIKKSLKQVLSQMQSSAKLKGQVSESKDKAKAEASEDEQAKEDGKIKKSCESKGERPKKDGMGIKENHDADNSGSVSMVCKKSKQVRMKEKQEMHGIGPRGDSLGKPRDVSARRTRVSKRNLSTDKPVVEEAPKAKTPKKNRVNEHHKADSPIIQRGLLETPQDMSLRRRRVMQNLGLIAPCGSPFRRNGLDKTVLPSL